jgi:hypothetical protein
MPALILSHPFRKLLVIGSSCNPEWPTLQLEDYDWMIFNGGICHPSFDMPTIKKRISQMQQHQRSVYVAGRYDLQCQDPEVASWIEQCPNVVIADFPSRSVVIVDGGIPINTNRKDVINNWEVSFASYIEGRPWHQFYDGGLGYVISNSPLNDKPQHFNYSMQLGSKSNTTYAQEVDEIGLKRLIQLPQ